MSENGTATKNPALELPLVDLPSAHPCSDCGKCCRYVAVEIDAPTAWKDFENIRWYLTHESICVYIDHENDWYIEFETRCEHLSASSTCDIYEDRPEICEDFSFEECEVTTGEDAYKVRFDHAPELIDWLKERRPKQYERYVKGRRKLLQKREAKRLAAAGGTKPPAPVPDPAPEATL